MRWKRVIHLLDVHCEGETGRVAIGGVPNLPGRTLAETLHHINTVDDSLRRFLCLEPRSSPSAWTSLLLPPTSEGADAGFIVLGPDRAHAMSGSNTICLTTALLEHGLVEMREPETVVTLDTAAGLVTARAQCRDGRCEKVTVTMVPAFVHELDVGIDTPEWGAIDVDIAYGGIFFALVDAQQIGLRIERANARRLVDAGMLIKEQLNARIPVVHPEIAEINGVAFVLFRDVDADGTLRTCNTMWPGRVDRSPCGTGSSAHMATLHARGEAKVGEVLTTRSIIDTEFEIALVDTTSVGDRDAVVSTVSGRGWTFRVHQIALDPTDPLAQGFALTDTWGPQAGEI